MMIKSRVKRRQFFTRKFKPSIRIIAHTHSRDFLGWVAMTEDDQAVGWVNLTFQKDKVIKFQDAFVSMDFRGRGIYNMLWQARMNWVEKNYAGKGYTIESWCKDTSIHQFIKQDFEIGETATRVYKEI
ncbi:MAG: GNAT family N-acetyltransferase [Flavobacteriales bacterium]|nr:GNAT family N-acetyltransferase [Flavobacteriales bacterium]